MYSNFFSAVETYRDENARRANAISKLLPTALKFKGRIFQPTWWRDKQKRIWWQLMLPFGTDPLVPFVGVFRCTNDAHALRLPRDAVSAIDCMEEEWPWPNRTDDDSEDSYTTWRICDQVFTRSAVFAIYLLKHQGQVQAWVSKNKTVDSALQLWEEFTREFKRRAQIGVNDPLFETQALEKAFRDIHQTQFN